MKLFHYLSLRHALHNSADFFREIVADFRIYFSFRRPLISLKLLLFARKVRFGKDGFTMVKREHLKRLYYVALDVSMRKISGDIIECGSWNGGAAALIAYAFGKDVRDVHLFDSFEGLPTPTPKDGERASRLYRKGWCLADVQKVYTAFDMIPFPRLHLHVHKGWFKDTFPNIPLGPIAFLHIDADWYESVMLCLEHFYPSVVEGGYIFFDDYSSWEGCRAAVDEFIAKHGLSCEIVDRHYIIKK